MCMFRSLLHKFTRDLIYIGKLLVVQQYSYRGEKHVNIYVFIENVRECSKSASSVCIESGNVIYNLAMEASLIHHECSSIVRA